MEEKLECKNIAGYNIWQGTTPKFDDINVKDFFIDDDKFNSCLLEFDLAVKMFFNKSSRNLYNQNIQSLKINEEKVNLFKRIKNTVAGLEYDYSGAYSSKDNEIIFRNLTLNKDSLYRDAIMHELLHMASRKNVGMTGFSQRYNTGDSKIDIGTMLNEGYTEYLNNKFFNKNIEGPYKEQMIIAHGIENIVGETKMMELYFNADLYGLVKELAKYTTEANAMDLVIRTDIVSNLDGLYRDLGFVDIKENIAKIYKKKLDLTFDLGLIDQDEYDKREFKNVRMYSESKQPVFNVKEYIFTKRKKNN